MALSNSRPVLLAPSAIEDFEFNRVTFDCAHGPSASAERFQGTNLQHMNSFAYLESREKKKNSKKASNYYSKEIILSEKL